MQSFLFIIFSYFLCPHPYSIDQRPDLLIIGNDTIMLKSFPLEYLGFKERPFTYGKYDFPGEDCYRGYQAVWKVIDNKLFLADLIKVDDPMTKIDIVEYFTKNEYTPIVIDGLIFADWFTIELTPFPRDFKYFGCIWKSHVKKSKAAMRFENGVIKLNRCKRK
jgi:hypothetical protein